ncbi:MAG: NAD(P)-dependent oxidoreductase [Phreatobacter sp.]|uniref:NAD(P)-dependent oxidoreductase n=1 Tax=Phreatobacter sp. TaxID=1966341 RepID=UPI00273593C9|nr:NAD(P)-dependent oxidoreductase [Phreatobacter sp.]MDP2803220.1 NAD(P)-dependent oxidoreductase [Phreatobacter sp.]
MTGSAGSVAFIGIGVMGAGMAANLAQKGFATTVFNRSAAKAAPLAAAGARVAASAREAVGGAEVVFLCLPATSNVEALLFGPEGIADILAAGTVVVDTSTIDPVATRAFAESLAARGVAMLDAPVSGGQKGAVDGTLTCMVGGPAEALETARPFLAAMATTIVHIGASGAGQVAKACNQICVSANLVGASEAMALAMKMGVDPSRVREALLGGAARSVVLERHVQKLLDRDFRPGFRTALITKDLTIAAKALNDAQVFAPVSAAILQILKGLAASGRQDDDWCSVGDLIQQLSAIEPADRDTASR